MGRKPKPGRRKRVRVSKTQRPRLNVNFLFLVILVTVFALAHLWQRTDVKHMLKEMRQMQQQVEQLVQENKQLQIRMIELSSAERIQRIAEKQLGMIPARKTPHVVYYRDRMEDEKKERMMAVNLLEFKNLAAVNPSVLLESMGE